MSRWSSKTQYKTQYTRFEILRHWLQKGGDGFLWQNLTVMVWIIRTIWKCVFVEFFAKWRKKFSKWRKKTEKWRKTQLASTNFAEQNEEKDFQNEEKNFQNEENFSSFYRFFLNYTKKTHKLKKAICTFIFTFIQCSNFFLLFKNFKKVHSGVSNGHSGVSKWALGPFKITRFARDFKIGPLAHFRLPLAHLYSLMNNFEIFLTEGQIFLTGQRENKTNKVLFSHSWEMWGKILLEKCGSATSERKMICE